MAISRKRGESWDLVGLLVNEASSLRKMIRKQSTPRNSPGIPNLMDGK